MTPAAVNAPNNEGAPTFERDEARAEVARLRGVVEAVRAGWAQLESQDTSEVRAGYHAITAALASVPSSGETGERAEAFVELLPADVGHNLRHFGPETRHVTGHECHCRPEPIPHPPASPEPTGADEGLREQIVTAIMGHFKPPEWSGCSWTLNPGAAADDVLTLLAARPVLSREARERAARALLSLGRVRQDGLEPEEQVDRVWADEDFRAAALAQVDAVLAAVLDTQEAE